MKKLYHLFFIIIFIFMLVNSNKLVSAQPKLSSLESIDSLADEALQMVQIGKVDESLVLLQYLSEQLLQFPTIDQTFTMDELKILTIIVNESIKVLQDPDKSMTDQLNKITQLRLVADAITQNYEPLWVRMEDQLLSALYDVKEALIMDNPDEYFQQFNSFLSLYEVVYPSLSLDASRQALMQLDMSILYFDEIDTAQLQNNLHLAQLDTLEDQLKTVFARINEDEADPSLWWVIFSTGGIIVITLSYVGWRKYVGQKNKKKLPSNRQNN